MIAGSGPGQETYRVGQIPERG